MDVLYLGGRNTRFSQGQPDGAGGLFAALLQADPVIGLAGGSIPGNFSVDVGAAPAGLLQFLHDEEPGALREHEPVAVARERTRRALRLMIPVGAHDAHQLETAQDQGSDRRIYSSRHDGVQDARLDLPVGIADGIGGRGAARRNDVAESAEPEAHGDFAGQSADRAGRNGVDAALLDMPAVVEAVLFFGEILASAARARISPKNS